MEHIVDRVLIWHRFHVSLHDTLSLLKQAFQLLYIWLVLPVLCLQRLREGGYLLLQLFVLRRQVGGEGYVYPVVLAVIAHGYLFKFSLN